MRVALIFNKAAGRGRKKSLLLDGVIESLSAADMVVDVYPTEAPGHATELARRARAVSERVLAWGGDGTLNEVAAGLLGSEVPMGVLPGGTVNVFARELGIPLRLEEAVKCFVSGRVVSIPVGLANGRPFLLMVGVGLDGEVVHRLESSFKDRLGALAFWLDGLRVLARFPMSPVTVRADGREIVCSSVVIGKLRRYGPRYFITPEAKVDEPKLHTVLFKGRKRRDYLRYLFGVLGGLHLRFGDVDSFKTDRLEVRSTEEVRVQIDGEPAGHTPLSIEVRDRGLSVVLPESTRWADRG